MSLEQEVANLVVATTELTDAVNIKKSVLDEAVDGVEAIHNDLQTNWSDKLATASQQATIATAQAGIATNKATEAAGSATTAVNAKTAAEAARDAAILNSPVYPDDATGRDAVADGEYFKVIGSGDVAAREYQRTDESTSVLVAEYPSIGLFTNIPTPNKSPIANSNGKIDNNWIDQTIFIKDPLRQSVEAASGGSYTVVYTPKGQPNFLFRQPAFNLEDVALGGELGTGLHPAFIFNGIPEREIFVGAYPAAMVNGEIVCQPGRDPAVSINFDNARAACQALGAGWDIMSNWDWAAIALWCMANGFQPLGNTNYGQHHANRWETGTRVVDDIPGSSTNTNGRTLTGSGPAGWSHNNTPGGIHDLVGNVLEWNQGLILDDNIFKIAPDNGTYLESEFIDTAYAASNIGSFSTRPYTDPPLILKQGLVVPASASLAPVGHFIKMTAGLRLPIRGGSWSYGLNAGLGALYFVSWSVSSSVDLGFRPRFRVI